MSTYYYLIAGLPDLTLEDGKLSYTVTGFKSDVYPDLAVRDRNLLDLFYLKFDNKNLLGLLQKKEFIVDLRGNFTVEELNSMIVSVKEGDEGWDKKYPTYFRSFIAAYICDFENENFKAEDILAGYYYAYAMNCGNNFIASWFEFNLNVNNILSALSARKYKQEVITNIVGDTDVCEMLRRSNARDFGLTGTLEYFEQLLRINEIQDLVEREKKIDLLKWNWMEDAVFFNYFTIERIFVFLLKLEMIERWISLDKEKGNELFRKIIKSLKDEVQIPGEFTGINAGR